MPKLTTEQLIAKYEAMYEYENDCLSKGFKMIGGIDEPVLQIGRMRYERHIVLVVEEPRLDPVVRADGVE